MKQIRMLALTAMLIYLSNNPMALAYNDGLLPRLNQGEPGQKKGDIIAPVTNEEVAAWCDFNQMIVATTRSFLCVFNGKPVP